MAENVRERIEREVRALEAPLPGARWGTRARREATHLAGWFDLHYLPSVHEGQPLPGMVATGLPPYLSADIRHLDGALGDLSVALCAKATAFPTSPIRVLVGRGHDLLRWRATVEPGLEPQVRNLLRLHAGVRSAGDCAVALSDALRLVRADEAREHALRQVDAPFFDDAETTLRDWSAWRAPDTAPLKARRAALATLLQRKTSAILGAADIVFHRFPEIAREARSPQWQREVALRGRTGRRPATTDDPQPAPEPATDPT